MSRHLSTRNISSKYIHAFLSNLANRQTDRQPRAKTFASSFVGGKKTSDAGHSKRTVFAERCYASAANTVMRCLSICPSVRVSVTATFNGIPLTGGGESSAAVRELIVGKTA